MCTSMTASSSCRGGCARRLFGGSAPARTPEASACGPKPSADGPALQRPPADVSGGRVGRPSTQLGTGFGGAMMQLDSNSMSSERQTSPRKSVPLIRNRGPWALALCLLVVSSRVPAVASETTIAASVASLFVGEEKIVEDTVTSAERDGTVVRLRLGRPPQDLSVALIIGLLSAFPSDPEHYYLGKPVRVAGVIRSFRGATEMEIHDPARIQLVATTGLPVVHPPAATRPLSEPAAAAGAAATEESSLRRQIDQLNERVRQLEERLRQLERGRRE